MDTESGNRSVILLEFKSANALHRGFADIVGTRLRMKFAGGHGQSQINHRRPHKFLVQTARP